MMTGPRLSSSKTTRILLGRFVAGSKEGQQLREAVLLRRPVVVAAAASLSSRGMASAAAAAPAGSSSKAETNLTGYVVVLAYLQNT